MLPMGDALAGRRRGDPRRRRQPGHRDRARSLAKAARGVLASDPDAGHLPARLRHLDEMLAACQDVQLTSTELCLLPYGQDLHGVGQRQAPAVTSRSEAVQPLGMISWVRSDCPG